MSIDFGVFPFNLYGPHPRSDDIKNKGLMTKPRKRLDEDTSVENQEFIKNLYGFKVPTIKTTDFRSIQTKMVH